MQPQTAQEVRGLLVQIVGEHLVGHMGGEVGPDVGGGAAVGAVVAAAGGRHRCVRGVVRPVHAVVPPVRPVHHRGTGSGRPAGLVSDSGATRRPSGRLVMSLGHAGASGRQ
ncbi:hypothetical protein RB199_34985 [Streptomyces libani]